MISFQINNEDPYEKKTLKAETTKLQVVSLDSGLYQQEEPVRVSPLVSQHDDSTDREWEDAFVGELSARAWRPHFRVQMEVWNEMTGRDLNLLLLQMDQSGEAARKASDPEGGSPHSARDGHPHHARV